MSMTRRYLIIVVKPLVPMNALETFCSWSVLIACSKCSKKMLLIGQVSKDSTTASMHMWWWWWWWWSPCKPYMSCESLSKGMSMTRRNLMIVVKPLASMNALGTFC